MDIKKILLVTVILINTVSCSFFSDDDGCSDDNDSRPATVENLLKIEPLNQEFNIGDVIFIQLEIPSVNSFFSNPVDLFDDTGTVDSWVRNLDHRELTEGNTTIIERGRLEDNGRAYVIYNEDTNNYELIYNVTLNRTGRYDILISPGYRMIFPTDDNCDFNVETSLNGFPTSQTTTFTFQVIP